MIVHSVDITRFITKRVMGLKSSVFTLPKELISESTHIRNQLISTHPLVLNFIRSNIFMFTDLDLFLSVTSH